MSDQITDMSLEELTKYFYARVPPQTYEQAVEAWRAGHHLMIVIGRRSEKDTTVYESNAVAIQNMLKKVETYMQAFEMVKGPATVLVPTHNLQ